MEAEYISLLEVGKEAIFLNTLLYYINKGIKTPYPYKIPPLLTDN